MSDTPHMAPIDGSHDRTRAALRDIDATAVPVPPTSQPHSTSPSASVAVPASSPTPVLPDPISHTAKSDCSHHAHIHASNIGSGSGRLSNSADTHTNAAAAASDTGTDSDTNGGIPRCTPQLDSNSNIVGRSRSTSRSNVSSRDGSRRSSHIVDNRSGEGHAQPQTVSRGGGVSSWLPSFLTGSGSHRSKPRATSGTAGRDRKQRDGSKSIGDATLDRYKSSVETMVAQVEAIKSELNRFAQSIVNMAELGSTVAHHTSSVCEESDMWPAALSSFSSGHRSMFDNASSLFSQDSLDDSLEPLNIWMDEAAQFQRELIRTNEMRIKALKAKAKVDELFMKKEEKEEKEVEREGNDGTNASPTSTPSPSDINSDFDLMVAKSDLGQCWSIYDGRLKGLLRHYNELRYGRIEALDVAATRFNVQLQLMFRPLMRAFDTMVMLEGANGGTADGGIINEPNLLSPSMRNRLLTQAGELFSPSGRRRVNQLEDELLRSAQNRLRRRSYVRNTYHYHSHLLPPTHTADAPDIHPSLRRHSRPLDSEGDSTAWRRGSRPSAADAAIIDACRQLQEEISSRQSTEEENARLRQQLQELSEKVERDKKTEEHEGERDENIHSALEDEIASLKKQLAEREANTDKKEREAEKEEGKPIADVEVPQAPPLDIPAPPPPSPPPGPPPAPFAPSGSLSFQRHIVNARLREEEEARKYGLPLLPEVEMIENTDAHSTSNDGVAASQGNPKHKPGHRVVLKKLHWTPLPTHEIVETKNNVWKELFMRAKKQGRKEGWVDEEKRREDDPLSIEEKQPVEVEDLAIPLILSARHPLPTTDSDADPDIHAKPLSPASASFIWRWPVDTQSFIESFAQKTPAALNKRSNNKRRQRYMARKGDTSNVGEGENGSGSEMDENTDGAQDDHHRKAPVPVRRIELLDPKRSYNLSISLQHLRSRTNYTSPLLLRDAILHMEALTLKEDDSKKSNTDTDADPDVLDLIHSILPTSDEVLLLRNWIASGSNNVADLADVEQFMVALSSPAVHQRLECRRLMTLFDSQVMRIEDWLECIQEALDCMKEDRPFISIVLALILRFGNLMNCSTRIRDPQGNFVQQSKQVYGFHLPSTLPKLRMIKTKEGSGSGHETGSSGPITSLLHYLVQYVSAHVPCGEDLTDELVSTLLPLVRRASKIEQAFIVAEVKQLSQDIRLVHALIEEDQRQIQVIEQQRQVAEQQPGSIQPETESEGLLHNHDELHGDAASDVTLPSPTSDSNQLSSCPSSAPLTTSSSYIPLPQRVYAFYDYAQTCVHHLEKQLSLVQQLYADEAQYYMMSGEGMASSGSVSSGNGAGSSSLPPWQDFFQLFASFLLEWSQASDELAEHRAKELQRIRQNEAAELVRRRKAEKAQVMAITGKTNDTGQVSVTLAATEDSTSGSSAMESRDARLFFHLSPIESPSNHSSLSSSRSSNFPTSSSSIHASSVRSDIHVGARSASTATSTSTSAASISLSASPANSPSTSTFSTPPGLTQASATSSSSSSSPPVPVASESDSSGSLVRSLRGLLSGRNTHPHTHTHIPTRHDDVTAIDISPPSAIHVPQYNNGATQSPSPNHSDALPAGSMASAASHSSITDQTSATSTTSTMRTIAIQQLVNERRGDYSGFGSHQL